MAGFGLTIIVVLTAAIVAYLSARRFMETSRWVSHTQEVLVTLDETFDQVQEIESGARGYLLTGSPRYRLSYEAALKLVDQKIKELRRLTFDNRDQQHRIDLLEPLIYEKIAFIGRLVATREHQGYKETLSLMQTDEGADKIDRVRQIVSEIKMEENRLLEERRKEATRSAWFANMGLFTFTIVDLALLLLVYYLIRRDNSERNRSEKALFQLASIVESSEDAIVGKTLKGIISSWNRGAEKIYGYTAEEALGKSVSIIMLPERVGEIDSVLEAVKQGKIDHYETERVRKDGTRIHVSLALSPIKDADGVTIGISAISRDISVLKRKEEELNHFFSLSLDMLYIAGFDGYFKRINPQWERVLGLTEKELLSKPLLEWVHPDDLESTRLQSSILSAGSAVVAFENRYRCRDGSYRLLLWNAVAIPEERLIFATGHDITERKKAEELLELEKEKLAQSNTELERFAYVASHDLQEPLRMVASYTQLLGKRYKGKLDSDADEFIGFAVDGASRMQNLIQDLLDYSRVGTKGRQFERVDCESVLKQTLLNLKLTIEDNNAVVTHDPLPVIMADRLQYVQLFQNLIGNAVKFHGAEAPRLHLSAKQSEGTWLFSFQDNGIGIAAEYADRIFAVFQRLHSQKEYPGTGIGLAICKKIVERHQGRIWFESEKGKGTTFYFTMPDGGKNGE